jgi:hypothetical protein
LTSPHGPGSLERLAAELGPAVLEEAVRESRRRATEILTARLTDLLVEEASRDRRQRPATPDTSAATGWYVYGLTWPAAAAAVAVVSPLLQDRGWGIAGDGEVDLQALAPRLAEHQHVLEEILERGPVLPLRFGVMYPNLDAVQAAVRQGLDPLTEELRRLDGLTEWGLTVEWEREKARAAGAIDSDPADTAAPNGRAYLARRQSSLAAAEVAGAEVEEATSVVHAALSSIAEDAIVQIPRTQNRGERSVVLRASYLLRRQRVPAFRRAADEAMRRASVHLNLSGELTGPWPAYSFVDVQLEGAST